MHLYLVRVWFSDGSLKKVHIRADFNDECDRLAKEKFDKAGTRVIATQAALVS